MHPVIPQLITHLRLALVSGLDGWPNRDLNVGAIISLTDNAQPIADMLHVDEATLRTVLGLWGPGKFAAVLFMDGKAFRPDGKVAANLIPAAFGLKGVSRTTYTGWGDISYWNSFVANLEMHGQGRFFDPRLNNPDKYPIAVENSFYNVMNTPRSYHIKIIWHYAFINTLLMHPDLLRAVLIKLLPSLGKAALFN